MVFSFAASTVSNGEYMSVIAEEIGKTSSSTIELYSIEMHNTFEHIRCS